MVFCEKWYKCILQEQRYLLFSFSLCFNVTCIARKSDGEHGETNVLVVGFFGVCLGFF